MPAESECVQVSNSFYWEESTVSVGSSTEDLLLFRKHCRDLREVIHSTWVQKQSGEKISSAKFASLILSLKELNRRTQFRIRKARDRTTEQKLNVDKLHLNLQNLLYEVAHLENEIKTCLEFKSQHEKLSLIPVEEFFLATGRQSDAPLSHEETLERLYWELDQRKNWSASCQKLMQSVESVSQEISQKRKYLASFAPKLKELVDNTLVIQKLMDLPFSKEEEQHQLAFLLPTPLYILYTHLKSYLSTMDYPPQTSVEIEGDGELAKAVNQAAAATSALGIDLSPDAEESDMDDVAEEKKRKTKRRKGDVSSHPPSHASNKAISLHPLRVVFRLAYPCGPNGKEDSHRPNQILPSSLSSVPLTAIEAGRPVLSKEQQKLVPRTVEVRLTNWKKSSMSALENVPRARKLIALKLIQSSDLIFHCEFHRSEYVPVPVWVAVPPEYPNRAPVLVVHNPGHETSMTTRAKNRIEWELSDLNLQDLEAEVNCYWTEFFADTMGSECSGVRESTSTVWNILSCQLVRCAVCLHALSSGDSTTLDAVKTIRYPTRSHPLRYLPSLGLFTHR
ncbi:putative THO complex subunit [Fasciola hepatica]|uniref:THO complex subunit n=1 Tax=Fasciola hepatica TaxID=6192 RepID=A0A4E0RY77_FASHE|nr:putative THO complex subunit [Fasciola hepatica]